MSELISRADVEQTVEDNILCYTHSDRLIDQDPDTECHMAIRTALRMLRKDLRKLRPVEPQIIRCKECRHRDEFGCCKYWVGLTMGMPTTATDDDDFCSHAERKEVTE